MNAMPLPRSEPLAEPPAAFAEPIASAAPANNPGAAPPHLLWAALETAYATRDEASPFAEEQRLAPYVALPLALGLSLGLWVIIVELVLRR